MKKMRSNMVLAIFISLVLFSSLSAQRGKNFTENEINNLIIAIQSDNEGLKASAIYIAGYYKLDQTIPSMLESFSKESEKNKILIALTLYQIGEESGLTRLMQLADKEGNKKVKKRCRAVMAQYIIDKNH